MWSPSMRLISCYQLSCAFFHYCGIYYIPGLTYGLPLLYQCNTGQCFFLQRLYIGCSSLYHVHISLEVQNSSAFLIALNILLLLLFSVLFHPKKCRRLCCGMMERVREQNGEEFLPPPLSASEPTAPPYMYSYLDRTLNGSGRRDDYHLDHYKLDYDLPEAEPLTRHDRSTRI